MKKIAVLLVLAVALAFAGEPAGKAAIDSVIQNPTKAQLAKATPLNNTICPVSQEKIGNMGMAVPVIYKGKIVNLCCKGCPADFAKNPEKYMKIIQEELAKNKTPAASKNNMEGMDHSKMSH